jgi:hypothetical protein
MEEKDDDGDTEEEDEETTRDWDIEGEIEAHDGRGIVGPGAGKGVRDAATTGG